ncbi:MAG TPA: class I SAM-dependent methyltransferase [Longimicrobium sp.]|jgi:SAM-dependent methyltransferase|uniref:class I SAM-dependent methyltransferase n=1 Tax=Longimicrobium sp. TaxID=2029185 RepID=UPI002EDA1D8D
MSAVDVKRKTAESFAYEWDRFSAPPEEWEANFRGYFRFFPDGFFAGKQVLEAGSGMGRHTFYLAKLARRVVSIDLGDAIRVTQRNTRGVENLALAQADIDHPPLRAESFDFVCSIGVLHHLPDPEAGFRSLLRLLRPGGTIHVYLYWALEDAPAWKRGLLRAVRAFRRLTVRMPYPLLDKVAWVTAAGGYATFVLPYRYLSRHRATRGLVAEFPLQVYAQYPFKVCYNDQFDRLSAPLEFRYSRAQVEEWFHRAGLEDVRVEPHFGWIACGRKPESAGA